ncbi:MAG: hypothetical protein DWI57_06675 [Chloroflexi bacterium]|nr:MAG: hypothetical protein DWI57_06675 [Chloroflexota bacterium]
MAETTTKATRRAVPALLIEATPPVNGIGYWLLACPILLFLAWLWLDVFAYYSPIPWGWLDWFLGALLYWFLFVLPVGYASHWLVTALPRPFQHTGWDVQPLEAVRPAEFYTVRYVFTGRRSAPRTRQRIWLRAAQGWVYLEVAAIFIGFVLMIPLFFSALDFGFGR